MVLQARRLWSALALPLALACSLLVVAAPVTGAAAPGAGVLLAGDEEGNGEGLFGGEAAEGAAKLAFMALAVNGAYIPYKWLRPALGIRIKEALPIHMLAGYGAAGLGLVHGVTAESSNALLWLGLGLMVYATLAGILLKYKWVPGRAKKAVMLLHAQRAAFWVLLGALFIGHLLVGD